MVNFFKTSLVNLILTIFWLAGMQLGDNCHGTYNFKHNSGMVFENTDSFRLDPHRLPMVTSFSGNSHILYDQRVGMRSIFSAEQRYSPKRTIYPPADGYKSRRSPESVDDEVFADCSGGGGQSQALRPGSKAPPFVVSTLDRSNIVYPVGFSSSFDKPAMVIHTYDNRSGFIESMWSSDDSIDGLIDQLPTNVQVIFLSRTDTPLTDALWMQGRIEDRAAVVLKGQPHHVYNALLKRMHFVPTGEHELGNWIPDAMKQWRCADFNCGYYQAVFRVDPFKSAKTALQDCMKTQGLSQSCRHLWGIAPIVLKRQDARYDWTLSPQTAFRNSAVKVAFGGHACKRIHFRQTASGPAYKSKHIDTKEAFIVLALDGMCSHASMVHNMAVSGASGLIVMMASPKDLLREIRCSPAECSATQDSIAVTAVPYDRQLLDLIAAGAALTVHFQVTASDNFFIGIDTQGRLQEIGSLLYPSMQFLNWAAAGMLYRDKIDREISIPHVYADRLFDAVVVNNNSLINPMYPKTSRRTSMARNLALKSMNESQSYFMTKNLNKTSAAEFNAVTFAADQQKQQLPPAVLVNVFDGDIAMRGHNGAQNIIRIPDIVSRRYRRLKLDLQLSCAGATDKTCDKWDHAVKLTTCCRPSLEKVGVECQESRHQLEIGRWVSPYRRSNGRWLTDISPLLPIFRMGEYCNLTIRHPWWSEPWYPKLSLRFGEPRIENAVVKPSTYAAHVVPLFIDHHAPFDNSADSFAARFPAVRFSLPFGLAPRAVIYAVITGHGSDAHRACAEFCVSRHIFTVNAHNYTRQFGDASTPFGCAAKVREGVTPNQHGTWLYGRAGWCPGQNVEPWVVDVSSSLKFGNGEVNVLSYSGAHAGSVRKRLSPLDAAAANEEIRASINIVTYLILYRNEI